MENWWEIYLSPSTNPTTLRKQFCRINKNILLLFMQQNSFIVPKKHFAISMKFWLLTQNVLSGQQKKFCCIHFFLSARDLNKIWLNQLKFLFHSAKSIQNNPTNYFFERKITYIVHKISLWKFGKYDRIHIRNVCLVSFSINFREYRTGQNY